MDLKTRFVKKISAVYEKCFLHKGWKRAYFVYHICRCILSLIKKTWKDQKSRLRLIMEENHKDLLSEKPMSFWIRDFFFSFFLLGAYLETNYLGNLMIGNDWQYKKKTITTIRNRFATKYLISPEAEALCSDKTRLADLWVDWYKRRYCRVSPDEPITAEQLSWVANGKGSVIVKPIDSYGGKGVLAYDVLTDESLLSVVDRINQSDEKCIVEERIIQTGLLHELNPDSVNTCRIITARHINGDIELLCTYLRLGGAGSLVDNFSAGGIQYVIDKETGILDIGTDGNGCCYNTHPASGKTVTGAQIPHWEDAIEFCFSAHRHAPEGLVLIGWDLCISDDGMSLVELNTVPGFCPIIKESEDHWGAVKNLLNEADRKKTAKIKQQR